ncbi:MAG: c-type cytochrome [Anaerolineales bacterium]
MNRGLALAIIAIGLLISGCSLAGDVTPPPALATAQMAAPAAPATPPPLLPPATQPNLAAGADIFIEKCAPCHGPVGLGDGELADGLAFAPAPLGDPEFARSADPADWYRAVTIGNLDRLMPGFTSLTDQQRWDVVGYALSLGAVSAQELVSEIEDQLQSGSQRATSLEPETDLQTGSVTGRISNGSAGASLPADIEVMLRGFDGDQEVVSESMTLESDGSYAFEGLEYVPGRLFFTTVVHEGLTYRSDIAHAAYDGSAIDLPITIFETSNDPSALRVERLHLIVDFPAEDVLRVLELWVLANDSDRVLTWPLQVALPDGATNLSFEDGTLGGRYEITGDGFMDLEPIPPGTGIDHLAFGFDLAISRSADFDQQMLHPVDAVTVLIPADGPRVSGLLDRGVQELGGLRMQTFTAAALAPEDLLSFRVSAPPSGAGPPLDAIVGVGALAIAVLAAVRVWMGPRSSLQDLGQQNWVEAIARLDDDYEAGALSEEDWRGQRNRMKRRALDQMRRSDD